MPADSRAALPGYEWLKPSLVDEKRNTKVRAVKAVADRLGVPMAQLALAWCVKNPRVSTVITGASKPEQVVENFKAMDVVALLTDDVMAELDAATK